MPGQLNRGNLYGSGSLWSGRLAAMLFSLFQTVQAWNLDVAKWLTGYLSACAANQGKPPPDLLRHLPWNMTSQERDGLRVATAGECALRFQQTCDLPRSPAGLHCPHFGASAVHKRDRPRRFVHRLFTGDSTQPLETTRPAAFSAPARIAWHH